MLRYKTFSKGCLLLQWLGEGEWYVGLCTSPTVHQVLSLFHYVQSSALFIDDRSPRGCKCYCEGVWLWLWRTFNYRDNSLTDMNTLFLFLFFFFSFPPPDGTTVHPCLGCGDNLSGAVNRKVRVACSTVSPATRVCAIFSFFLSLFPFA